MPTPHPHHELARRIMPLAAYLRENDLGDGQLALTAVRGLAETLGLDVVVVDPDPEQRLEDLSAAYLTVLGQLAKDPDPKVRAALPGAVYELVLKEMQVLRGMYARKADGHQVSRNL